MEELKEGDRLISFDSRLHGGKEQAFNPGDYIRKVSGGWWWVDADGGYRNVVGALAFALEEKWIKEGRR